MWGSVFRLRIHPISNSFLFQPTQYFLSSGSQTPAVCPTPTFTSSQQVFPTWKRTAISSTQHPCPSLKKTSVLRFKGRYTACQLTGPHLQAGKPLFTKENSLSLQECHHIYFCLQKDNLAENICPYGTSGSLPRSLYYILIDFSLHLSHWSWFWGLFIEPGNPITILRITLSSDELFQLLVASKHYQLELYTFSSSYRFSFIIPEGSQKSLMGLAWF